MRNLQSEGNAFKEISLPVYHLGCADLASKKDNQLDLRGISHLPLVVRSNRTRVCFPPLCGPSGVNTLIAKVDPSVLRPS